MNRLEISVAALAIAISGCKGGESAPPPKPAAPPAAAPKPATTGKVKKKRMWMVPHPSEIVQVLRALGVADKTPKLVPITPVDFTPMDGQRVAFNTGVLVADLVLALDGSSGPDLAKRIDTIRTGLKELGMNEAQIADVDKLSKRLAGGKVTPDELAAELDTLQAQLMDDVSTYSSEDALVGIQAGAWVRAVNVVSTLLLQTGKAEEGAYLFAQPELVEYFSNYLNKNQDKAVENPAIKASLPYLADLKKIAAKEDLTKDDVAAVEKITGNILKQFHAAGGKP